MDGKKYMEEIENVVRNGAYGDSWDSLSAFAPPDWYVDAKFGIFIHWGVYSVPAFNNEWYPRNMYIRGSDEFKHHVATYGEHRNFGYKDFIPMFRAEKFDAEEWARLFELAGARYVVPVAEHHDGFQMYRSELSRFNAYEMGPRRDVLGELGAAFRKRGLVLGASSHRAEHWFFLGHGKEFDSDVGEPLARGDFYWPSMPEPDHQDLFGEPAPSREFLEDWLLRTCELVDRYRPELVYFDWWIQHNAVKPYLKKFAAYYYNRSDEWGVKSVITYKHDAFMFGCAVIDIERGQFAEPKPYFWQTDTSVALNSWCYTENNRYRPAREIIRDLADIVSKNGCLLLNVGPKADGTIPEEDGAILLDIGKWLKVNGEAIYGSRVWRTAGEGPTRIEEGQFTDGKAKVFTSEDIRFTVKGSYIYAVVLVFPESGVVKIRSLGEKDAARLPHFHGIIREVTLLGFPEKPLWKRTGDALIITVRTVKSDEPVVFRILVD